MYACALTFSKRAVDCNMSNSNVFQKIEKLINSKIPEGIEKILIECGFDSKATILLIKEDTIAWIETYLKQNVHILQNTPYANFTENSCDFKLKPGHKAFILNLPNIFNEKENIKNTFKAKSELELKEKLAIKVVKYCLKNAVEITVDINRITQFKRTKGQAKCKFSCPFCESKVACDYKTYWNVSNLERHIKIHFNNQNYSIESVLLSNNSENQNSNTYTSSKIQCYSLDNERELDEVLNE